MTLKSPSFCFHLPGTSKTDTHPLHRVYTCGLCAFQTAFYQVSPSGALKSTKLTPRLTITQSRPLKGVCVCWSHPPQGHNWLSGEEGKQQSDSLRKASQLKQEHLPCTRDFKAKGMAGVVRKCSSRCAAYKVYLVQTTWPARAPGCGPLSKQNGALKMAFRVEALARQA